MVALVTGSDGADAGAIFALPAVVVVAEVVLDGVVVSGTGWLEPELRPEENGGGVTVCPDPRASSLCAGCGSHWLLGGV